MIEIDFFGHNAKKVLDFVETRCLKRDVLRREDIGSIPEDYSRKAFYGRYSFADEDSRFVDDALTYAGLSPFDYEVVGGHFLRHVDDVSSQEDML